MILNQWYAVARAAQVRRKPLALTRLGRPLVLWRDETDQVRVARDICPHRAAALSRGKVVDGQLECPYHGFRFGSQGACSLVPAHPGLPYEHGLMMPPQRVERGLVWVWFGRGEPGPLLWDEAFDQALGEGDFCDVEDELDAPAMRILENLTDLHHVPFVHRSTLPGVGAQVSDFSARREGQVVFVEGTLGGSLRARMEVRVPGLALLEFVGQARFAVVMTPVDEHRVWLMARYTQTLVRLPVVGRWLTWLFGVFDYKLLQRLQDLPVWQSQRWPSPQDVSRAGWVPADEGVRLVFEVVEELGA